MKEYEDVDNGCYYVLNIAQPRVVMDITQDFLSKIVHYGHLITLSSFAQYDSLEEAKKARRENGGIILKGVRDV